MTNKTQTRKDDIITEKGTAIIAGHGRFGQIINRTLIASGYKTVVIDQQADLIEGMRKFGVQVFYGDATRLDLLHAAGIHEAKLLVVAIDEPEQAIKLIKQARLEHPDIHIVARARDRIEVYRLYYAGANDIVRETFDSAVRASQYALESLGMTRPKAIKQMKKFVEHDRKGLREMAAVWQEDIKSFENKEMMDLAKNLNAQLNELMKEDQAELQEELQQAEQVKP